MAYFFSNNYKNIYRKHRIQLIFIIKYDILVDLFNLQIFIHDYSINLFYKSAFPKKFCKLFIFLEKFFSFFYKIYFILLLVFLYENIVETNITDFCN